MLDVYSKITNSREYKEWKEKNPRSHLSSAYLDEKGWQFNFFYNKKLITFYLEDSIIKTEVSDIYELNKEMEELDLKEIKISLNNAEEIINKIVNEKKEKINKKIIILQKKEFPFWNLTYMTNSLNFFNVRINALTGEIIEQKFENILNLKSNLN